MSGTNVQKFCSIQRNKSRNGKEDFTCYNKNELIVMAKKLGLPAAETDSKQEIWKRMNETLKNCGGKEWCWARKLNRPDILESVFLPEGPFTGHEWLSNFDIDNVLTQYEIAFPTYKYAGCFSVEVSKVAQKQGMDDPLNPEKLFAWVKKYKYVGGVFNLDCYTCPGTHWTNFMITNAPSGIEFRYYDSVGNNNGDNPIPGEVFEIATALNSVVQAKGGKNANSNPGGKNAGGKKLGNLVSGPKISGGKNAGSRKTSNKYYRGSGVTFAGTIEKGANYMDLGKIKLLFNGSPHQRGDSECGVYSIHVQDLQINDHTFADICKMHLPDEKINTFRQIYFRPA